MKVTYTTRALSPSLHELIEHDDVTGSYRTGIFIEENEDSTYFTVSRGSGVMIAGASEFSIAKEMAICEHEGVDYDPEDVDVDEDEAWYDEDEAYDLWKENRDLDRDFYNDYE